MAAPTLDDPAVDHPAADDPRAGSGAAAPAGSSARATSPATDDGDAAPAGGRRGSRVALAIALALSLVVGLTTAAYIATTESDAADLEIVIAEGAGEQLEAGTDPGIVAEQIVLASDDVVTVENRDDRVHQIGSTPVRPGDTVTVSLAIGQSIQPCTVCRTGSVTFVVSE